MDKKRKFIINAVFCFLIFFIIWAVITYVFPVMVPFILAFLIASFLQIPIRRVYKDDIKGKRVFSVLLCIAFYVIIFLFLGVVGMKVVDSISGFLEFVPVFYQQKIVPMVANILDDLKQAISASDSIIIENIDATFEKYIDRIGNVIAEIPMSAVKTISGSIVGIPGYIVKIVLTIVSTFFFVVDYDRIINFVETCIPEKKYETFMHMKEYIKDTVLVFLRSYTLLFFLTFAELVIGFKLIGIPYAPVIGLAVAIFDILPILGTGGILLPWAVILILMKEVPMCIGMFVLYVVITIIRNTLEPRIVGTQIGLHPLATLISMYLGLKLFGIIGLFLFPVSLAVLAGMNKKYNLNNEG